MPASIIVWDIETVPDLRGFAAANGLSGNLENEVRAEMGDKFPKLVYHSIVFIGALVAQRQDEHWAISGSARDRSDHSRSSPPCHKGGSDSRARAGSTLLLPCFKFAKKSRKH